MTEVLNARAIDIHEYSDEERLNIASRFLYIVQRDFVRADGPPALIRDLDPSNKDNVQKQKERMENPSEGTVYGELYDEDEEDVVGAVKLGYWELNNAKPFGVMEQVSTMANAISRPERRTRGLHVFATTEAGMAKAGLIAVRYKLVPATAALKVAAAEGDEGLNQGLADLNASRGPRGASKAGKHEVPTRLWEIPPLA